jgi:hypothetical protein
MTAEDVATTIEDFVEGRGDPWDWDDFVSFEIVDPRLDAIRERCNMLSDEFPAGERGGYCGPEGIAVMRELVRDLRERSA